MIPGNSALNLFFMSRSNLDRSNRCSEIRLAKSKVSLLSQWRILDATDKKYGERDRKLIHGIIAKGFAHRLGLKRGETIRVKV